MLRVLVLISSGDIYARFVLIGILDTLELHSEVLVVVSLHGDAVGIHPVHDKLRQLDRAAADIRQVFPHVHDEEVVDSFSYGSLAVSGDVVVYLRFL